jgi:ribonucleoside-triphosphate reductase
VDTAKSYILYREQRRRIREAAVASDEAVERVDQYLERMDWEVQENANMAFSLQGLNHYAVSYIVKKYWLNKIYPKEISEANESGDFHLHNLDTLAPYCSGWDLYDFLRRGFGGTPGKLESKPPKHFRTVLGQIVNFIYTLAGEVAGAVSFSNFDTLVAPFIYYDNLNYHQVKQAMQEFLFNMATPTRVGFQCPFSNVTLDLTPSPSFAKQPVIIGGLPQDKTYGEFQEEMNMLNRAFYEVMLDGDKNQRVFTFPIPTVSITKNFDWDNPALEPMWEATAKYGVNYFTNYINSDMNPEDVRSMCCRLRLDLTELHNRGGGLFGSGALTGSIGVVTINMPRIGYLSKTKKEFFERLGHLMDLAKESLELKRKVIEDYIEKGLYPYSRHYLSNTKKSRGQYYANHFSTIGLVGMNEMLINFLGENIASKKGRMFAVEVMRFMRERMLDYQKETGNIYNLEATPAESTAYRLCLKDKAKYPDIAASGTKKSPYYTNSSQLPVNFTDDVFEALKLQDDIQCQYNGGTVQHLFLGERLSDTKSVKALVRKVFEKFRLPYITITPTFSICPTHGYISGEHFKCPKCTIEQPCEVYTRVVGYLRPVAQFNTGKQQEYKDRKEYRVKKESIA